MNRRDFLKTSGVGMAGLAAGPLPALAAAASSNSGIPPHQPLSLTGVHAYADQHSVAAGETIRFHLSHSVPCRLHICRLGLAVDDPAGDTVLHTFPELEPAAQPIHPGSYIHIAKRLQAPLKGFTAEAWVRPWKTEGWAGLISQHDFDQACGFGLFINPGGGISFYLGRGGLFEPECLHASPDKALTRLRWHHIAGTWNGETKELWIDGQLAGQWPFTGPFEPGPSPLRLAAYGENGLAAKFLDADLAMPALYSRALTSAEIKIQFQRQALVRPSGGDLLGCWPFDEEQGERIRDLSRFRRPGLLVNHATWMIGGPGFQPEVPRFDSYHPGRDETRGHGIRFASDDLYDCRWAVTHDFKVPANARSGIYVGRIEYELEGRPCLYHVPFIVRKPRRRRKAPILVLCASNTWLAYSGTPFAANSPRLKQVWGTGGFANSPGDPPAYNFYRNHAAGQGTFQIGLRIPWPAAGPYVLYGGPTDYSHLMRAERFTHAWLEEEGYEFDVITDQDLDRNPDLPRGYRVLMINGHNEYWSIPMYEGLRRFLEGGGDVVCLSGNSLFWRVSFNKEGSIIECRKVDAPGDQIPPARRGECWHSHDQLRGGLLRECGYPGWKLIGLETLGWNNQSDPRQFGPYIVEQPDHFLFQSPERVNVQAGDAIGQAPDGNLPRANGHEIDVRLSTLSALQTEPNPPGALLPGDPPNITRLANGIIPWQLGGAAFDYFFRQVKPETDQGGEMIYWERPDGGRVFNAGSIGAGWVLPVDQRFQTLLRNVLAHFGAAPGKK